MKLYSSIERLYSVKIPVLPKEIYIFSAIPFEISMIFLFCRHGKTHSKAYKELLETTKSRLNFEKREQS